MAMKKPLGGVVLSNEMNERKGDLHATNVLAKPVSRT